MRGGNGDRISIAGEADAGQATAHRVSLRKVVFGSLHIVCLQYDRRLIVHFVVAGELPEQTTCESDKAGEGLAKPETSVRENYASGRLRFRPTSAMTSVPKNQTAPGVGVNGPGMKNCPAPETISNEIRPSRISFSSGRSARRARSRGAKLRRGWGRVLNWFP